MTYSDNDSWEKYEDDDDLYSPPSSPPPPHIILYPENYHAGSGKSWQHNYASQIPKNPSNQNTSTSYHSPSAYSSSKPDAKRNNKKSSSTRYLAPARKHIFNMLKMLVRVIFTNNNLLLAVTLTNRLWRSRDSIFIKPYHAFLRQVKQFVPNDYQEVIMLFKMVRSFALHYYANTVSHKIQPARGKGNKHAILFMLSNLQKLQKHSIKLANQWIAQAIRSIGGLDAFILAIGTITFTKYLQRSNRIF